MAIIRARIDGIAVDLERPKPEPKPKKKRKRKPGVRIATPKTLPTVLKAMDQVRSSKLEILSLKREAASQVKKSKAEMIAFKEDMKKELLASNINLVDQVMKLRIEIKKLEDRIDEQLEAISVRIGLRL
jgi:hypothetical protein